MPAQPTEPATVAARAVRFLKGGLLVWIVVASAFALGALLLPRSYQSTALLEVARDGAPLSDPEGGEAVEQKLRAAVADTKQLGAVAALEGANPSEGGLARVGESISIRARSARTFEVSYRTASPDTAQKGCAALVKAVMDRFPPPSVGAASEDPRAVLDRKTKELTDFVIAHPEVALSRTREPSAPSTARVPATDPALALLRQEKARLEAALAEAKDTTKKAPADNPYEEPGPSVDVTALEKRLAEIRNALLAHQSAAQSTPVAQPASPNESEWKRLVTAVADAQRAAFAAPKAGASALVARVIEAPSLPSSAIESWRGPIAFLGVVLGLASGVLFVLFRVLSDRRVPVPASVPGSRAGDALPIATTAPESDVQPRPVTTNDRERPPSHRPEVPAAVSAGERALALRAPEDEPHIPRPPLLPSFGAGRTQIGMMDPAQFAAAKASASPEVLIRVESRRIIDVTAEPQQASAVAGTHPSTPVPPRRAGVEQPSPPPPRPSPPPPRPRSSPVPPAPRSPLPPRATQSGLGRMDSPLPPSSSGDDEPSTRRMSSPDDIVHGPTRSETPRSQPISSRSGTGYSFVDKDARGGMRRKSERPGQPISDRPDVVDERASTRVGWNDPASAGLTARERTRTGMTSRPPDPNEEDIIAPRSAPPSWRVSPAFADPAVQSELNALCEQLLSMVAQQRRCLVVAVTSDAETNRSRTAARLATMLGADGRARVLLMEADFDFPVLQRLMAIEMPQGSGFSQQMRARVKLEARRPWAVVRCSESLHVLAEGIVRTPGILFSQEFSDAVSELRRCYDLIVLAGPATGGGAEHKPLDAVTDGIVFVVEPGAPLGQALDRAAQWFKRKELVAAVPAEGAAPR